MSSSSNTAYPRSHVTLIEIDDEAVGLAVRDHAGFRFFTASSRFQPIDNVLFATLKALQAAARELAAGDRRHAALGRFRHRVGQPAAAPRIAA